MSEGSSKFQLNGRDPRTEPRALDKFRMVNGDVVVVMRVDRSPAGHFVHVHTLGRVRDKLVSGQAPDSEYKVDIATIEKFTKIMLAHAVGMEK